MEPSATLTSSGILTCTTAANNNSNSQTSLGQSQIIIKVLGGFLGITTFVVLILSLAMIIILRKKVKARSKNSIPDHTPETYEIPITTKEDPALYEMINNKIPSINTNNYSNYTSLSVSTTDNSTIYDIPETSRPQVSSCPYKVGHFK
ncbi:PREDICTED: uncharacterized protein LOC109582951 [Amphimedon queenslandica]|uniref:Uncharacterized protein n=1 Tax=Amphimedon queenslandica TaxID=400682 RepID=A0AAN0J9B0_AMPQE|nr:PREDICTED: uncharacterized protein LOC109582951 [Amphimedon queenslandica]|eukprot:XP_019853609.1 PREDICTED: uncharacterized protein LOC109582951 [Amphimedon queenslandica]